MGDRRRIVLTGSLAAVLVATVGCSSPGPRPAPTTTTPASGTATPAPTPTVAAPVLPYLSPTAAPQPVSGPAATGQIAGAVVSTNVPLNWYMTANTPNMWILRAGPIDQLGFLSVVHPVRSPAPGQCSAVPGQQIVPPTDFGAFVAAYLANPCLQREGSTESTTIAGLPATRWRVKVVNAPKDAKYCKPAGCILIAYEQLAGSSYDFYYLNQGYEEMLWAVDLGPGREPLILVAEEGAVGTLDALLPILKPAIDALHITLT